MYYNNDMKNILNFTIYILFFAVLSSLIFTLLHMQFDEQPMLALNKAIKYGAILLCGIFIVPALKASKLYQRQLVGYLEPKPIFLLNMLKGFLTSILLLAPLICFFAYLDIRIFDLNSIIFDQYFLFTIIFTVFISFLVGIIEESFFRGIMIQKNSNLIITSIVVFFGSAVYSIFHFIKIPLIIDEVIYWNTGLTELFKAFGNIFNIMQYDAALTLLVFGIFLAVIRLSLKTISYGIGLHAGFIFIIKTTKQVSNVDLNSEHKYLVSNHDQFLGSASTIWITTLLIIYLFYKFKTR